MRKISLIYLFPLLFLLVNPVYALDSNSTVNLMEIPNNLAEQLGIPVFAAQILVSSLFLLAFMLPLAIYTKGKNPLLVLIVAFPLMGFLVAIGWLPVWMMFVIVLITALMFSDKIKNLIGG